MCRFLWRITSKCHFKFNWFLCYWHHSLEIGHFHQFRGSCRWCGSSIDSSTHCGWDKMATDSHAAFSNWFWCIKFIFLFKFCSCWSNWQWIQTGSGNSFALNRWQTIAWTNIYSFLVYVTICCHFATISQGLGPCGHHFEMTFSNAFP